MSCYHLRNIFRRAGDDFGAFAAQDVQILEKCLFILRGVLLDGEAGGGGVANDLVVDVGDVHHMAERHAFALEEAAQHIDLQERPEVADVSVVVDGRPASVHAQRLAIGWLKLFDRVGEGIEKTDGHFP